jgi:hypothetical protein
MRSVLPGQERAFRRQSQSKNSGGAAFGRSSILYWLLTMAIASEYF